MNEYDKNMSGIDIVNYINTVYNIPKEGKMMLLSQRILLVERLQNILNSDIKGDIVELGCNRGSTSIWIQKILDINNSNKSFHVYDSFQGLPEGNKIKDADFVKKTNVKGRMTIRKKDFVKTFNQFKITPPIIHEGFFNEIPDKEYPSSIAFAFFDGDLYSSILSSFEKTYDKVEKGGIIIVHDYGCNAFGEGVRTACSEFLVNKTLYKKEEHERMLIIEK